MLIKESYFDIKAISNSSLRYIDPQEGGSPNKFKDFIDGNLKEKKASYLINGTLIHMAMLEPDKFEVAKVIRPPATLGDIAEAMIIQNLELDPEDENILNTIRAFEWQNNWGDATVVKKFKESGAAQYIEYMRELRNSGKIGMDENTGKIVHSCIASLKLNTPIMYLLEGCDQESHITSENELEVLWEQTVEEVDLKFKAKIDRLILDHQSKTYIIVDVKTTSKTVGQFINSFEEFNYPRQLKFYKKAVEVYLEQQGHKDFKFQAAYIVAVETTGYHTSQLFDVTPYLTTPYNTRLKELIQRVAYHYRENNWLESMESAMNDGVIELSPKKELEPSYGG